MVVNKLKLHFGSEAGAFTRMIATSAASQGAALVISMVGSILLTRALGAEGRGLLAWIVSLAMIAAAILQCGLGQTNRRFVAEDKSRAGDLAIFNCMVPIIGAIVVLPAFLLYAFMDLLSQNNMWLVIAGLMIAPVFAIGNNLSELLLGLGRGKAFNLFLLTQRSINSLLIVLLVVMDLVTPLAAVLVLVLSYYVQFFLVLFLLRKEVAIRLNNLGWVIEHLKSYVAANYVSNLMMIFASTIIPILLASKHSLKAAGVYATCMILIDAARSSIRMVSMHALPKIANCTSWQEKKKYIKQSVMLTLFFSTIAAVLLYCLAGWILPLLFGNEFVDGAIVLKWLAVGLVFAMLYLTLQAVLAALSTGWVIVIPGIVLGASTLLGALVLIPSYGAIGAAWVFIAGFAVALGVLIYLMTFAILLPNSKS